jgi:uncharacterized membrane protein YidH (DUF202 family)
MVMMSKVNLLVSRACLTLVALALGLSASGPALADHTTRTTEIQENGIDLYVMVGVIALIVAALIAFAVAILIWERNTASSDSGSSN